MWKNSKVERPDSNKPVIWLAKKFSKERGKLEAGRYDYYYDCFCGTASLFVNRRDTVKWIYIEDIFKGIKSSLDYLKCPDNLSELIGKSNEQTAFNILKGLEL